MITNPSLIIPLWPCGTPGSETWDWVEAQITFPDGLHLVHNVTQPSLEVYPAKSPNGTAVIVAPGGARHFLSIDNEGRQVAEWLTAQGVTAFVLKYRLLRTSPDVMRETDEFIANPASKAEQMRELRALNLADGQQAIRIVRARAAEWGVDPARIGFMGFSAGGGVTTEVALNFTADCRPDFAAPIYAAVFEEVQAPPDAPPLFLLCAADDDMASHASLILYSAWKAAQRPVEMHIYASGGHGFGMKQQGLSCDTWLERFADWLRGLGYA